MEDAHISVKLIKPQYNKEKNRHGGMTTNKEEKEFQEISTLPE